MKKGDIITCASLKDLEKTLEALSAAGFNGVRDSGNNFSIVITGVPETGYLVEARSYDGSSQKAYCSTLEEAEEAAAEYGSGFQWVEIMKGYAGEWVTVSQNW